MKRKSITPRARGNPCSRQAIGVAAPILEGQGIDGGHLNVHGLETALIGQQADALGTVNAVVVAAGLANAGMGNQVLAIDHLPAFGAFAPEAIALVTFGSLVRPHRRSVLAAISEPVKQRHLRGKDWEGPSPI
jgi:hypothetical protein